MLRDKVFQFYTKAFRGSLTKGKEITQVIRRRSEVEDLSICKEIHLSVLSTLLQSALLKGEERVRTISEHSFASHGLTYDSIVYTEKWGSHFVRGFADKLERDSLYEKNSFLVGKTLYGAESEFQTVGKLDDPAVGLTEKDLQGFFDKSEQISSKFVTKSENWSEKGEKFEGVGLLMQLMPGFDRNYLEEYYQEIVSRNLLKEISEGELDEDAFKTLFSSFEGEINYSVEEYEFKCNCSKESMIQFIAKIDVNELVQMKNSNHPVSCSHCNEVYHILPADIDLLIK